MMQGRTLQELAVELERQNKAKKDYIADTRRLKFAPTDGGVVLKGLVNDLPLNDNAHNQMASALDIPRSYYDRLLGKSPDLLASNVNHWLATEPAKKLIRTMDGKVRAIMTDSYRPLDNCDLVNAVLPQLMKMEVRVESCEVTESRLYLKVVTERVTGEVRRGETIQAGAMISNSEIGHGSLSLAYLDFKLACLNGLVRDHVVRKVHVGRKNKTEIVDDASSYFKDDTRLADDKAFFLKVRDAVGLVFDPLKFKGRMDEYRVAAGLEIEADPVAVVEEVTKRLSLSEDEGKDVLRHLIKDGDLTKWGLVNAITRAAQDADAYDRSTELETAASRIVELSASDWKSLAV